MSDHPFSQFISLVTLDKKIQSCIIKKSAIEQAISVIDKQKNSLAAVLDEIHHKIVQFKKNVDNQELEMDSLDQRESEKKRLLSTLTDYRECQAIKTEVDAIQRLQV